MINTKYIAVLPAKVNQNPHIICPFDWKIPVPDDKTQSNLFSNFSIPLV